MTKDSGFEDGVYYKKAKDPIYGVTYWVLISQSHSTNLCDQLISKYRPTYDYEPAHDVMGSCISFGGPHGFEIFLTFRKVGNGSVKAHEAVHAKNYVYKHAGINPDADNDEHEAYYVGFVTSLIEDAFEHMEQALKKKKKK